MSFYVIGCPCLLTDLSAKDVRALQRHAFYLRFDAFKVGRAPWRERGRTRGGVAYTAVYVFPRPV